MPSTHPGSACGVVGVQGIYTIESGGCFTVLFILDRIVGQHLTSWQTMHYDYTSRRFWIAEEEFLHSPCRPRANSESCRQSMVRAQTAGLVLSPVKQFPTGGGPSNTIQKAFPTLTILQTCTSVPYWLLLMWYRLCGASCLLL